MRDRGLTVVAVALGVLLAALFRWGYGLSGDEPFAANAVRLPWTELAAIFRTDNVPLHYLLLRGWTFVFGESEFALRSLSMTAYAAATVVTARAAAAVGGAPAGVLAAVLMATSVKIGLTHAATARPYALLSLFAALALHQTLGLVTRNHMQTAWRAVVLLAATHTLGLFTHPTYVFAVAASLLASAAAGSNVFRGAATSAAAASLGYLAIWWPTLEATLSSGATNWMRSPTLADIGTSVELLWGLRPGALLTATAIVVTVWRPAFRTFWRSSGARALAAFVAAIWIVPVAISYWKPIFFPARTPMLALPSTAMALAVLAAGRSRAVTVALIAVLSTAASILVIRDFRRGDPQPAQPEVAAIVGAASCGDTIVSAGLAYSVVDYYARQIHAPACISLERFPSDMLDFTTRVQDPVAVRTMQEEARALARRLAERPGDVLLVLSSRGLGHEASTWIGEAIGERFACATARGHRAPFFDSVTRCVAR